MIIAKHQHKARMRTCDPSLLPVALTSGGVFGEGTRNIINLLTASFRATLENQSSDHDPWGNTVADRVIKFRRSLAYGLVSAAVYGTADMIRAAPMPDEYG